MQYKIQMAQIDPNGLCNAGCWFCPVSYAKNPDIGRKDMEPEVLESILKQLHDGKGSFVGESFNFIYTAHYNEVLLYKHFEIMLDLFRKYNFKTMILTNGIPLTPNRIEIISRYLDVVTGICFNIPSSEAEEWGRLVKKNPKIFNSVMSNVQNAIESFPNMVKNKTLSIQINGVNDSATFNRGGWIDLLENSPKFNLDSKYGNLNSEHIRFKNMFPGVQIFQMPSLIDRAGILDKENVISNKKAIDKYLKKDNSKVIGCSNGIEVGGRPNGWIHINANGDMFICCNDFDFETVFGNVNEKPIEEIWMSLEHRKMVIKSYNTMCTTCASAIWA